MADLLSGTVRPQAVSMQLSSLLDLSSRLAESDSEERIVNAAVLSVMGKLKILRACVLQPDGGRFFVTHAKGMAPARFGHVECEELRFASPDDETRELYAAGIRWLVPLVVHGQVASILCFGPTLDGSDNSDDVITYMRLVRSITTTALHNAQMVRSLLATTQELQRQNLLVTTLFESARDFSGMTDVDSILRTLSYRLMGQLMLSCYAMYVREPINGRTVVVNRQEASALEALAHHAVEWRTVMRTEDISDDGVRTAFLDANVAAVAPLTIHGDHKGAIAVTAKLSGARFTDEELSFVESLGNTALAAIEQDRAITRELERQRLESELAIAATIQRGLLPLALPTIPDYDIAASTLPSKQVSGDYYDVITLDDHRTLFAIADVSGKGVPAALVMANVQAALNVLATIGTPLPSIADRINSLLCDNTEPDVFVTMFIAILDRSAHSLDYVNLGHNPPLVIGGKDVTPLNVGGILAGVIPSPKPYQMGTVSMAPDDVLLLYTDGVTEARDAGQNEFGVEAAANIVRAHARRPAADIVAALTETLETFTNGRPLDDDTSILVLKRRDATL
jgi:sigma-B regulation protein RsbU (phosphoserine phosphatase)